MLRGSANSQGSIQYSATYGMRLTRWACKNRARWWLPWAGAVGAGVSRLQREGHRVSEVAVMRDPHRGRCVELHSHACAHTAPESSQCAVLVALLVKTKKRELDNMGSAALSPKQVVTLERTASPKAAWP